MIVEDAFGLQIAVMDADQALAGGWRFVGDDVDLVRVREPADDDRLALAAAGFVVKPSWLTWMAPTLGSEAEFVGRLPGDVRRTITKARRVIVEHGIRLGEPGPLDEAVLDEFLELYRRQVGDMRHGVPFAVREWDALLAAADDHLLVRAHAGATLVGGCLCRVRAERSTLQVRYSATDAKARRLGLARLLYLRAFDAARALGIDRLVLGNDPSLFGHIVKPGLFRFKVRLGFSAVPSQAFIAEGSTDEADLVLRLTSLTDPTLVLGYPTVPGPGLRMEILTHDATLDPRPYRASFVRDVRMRELPK